MEPEPYLITLYLIGNYICFLVYKYNHGLPTQTYRENQEHKKLVKEKREHLIPELVKRLPNEYLSLEHFNIIDAIKPWVEISKPRKQKLLKSGLETLALVVRDNR